jgi:hypothetical protein
MQNHLPERTLPRSRGDELLRILIGEGLWRKIAGKIEIEALIGEWIVP